MKNIGRHLLRLAQPNPPTTLTLVALLSAVASLPCAAAASFQGLGQMPGTMAGAGTYCNGVSGDGNVVIGYTWTSGSATRPFRWTAAAGFEDLGDLGGTNSSNCRAYGASLDGSVIVGQSSLGDQNLAGFRWVAGVGMAELPLREAIGVTADGSMVVGGGLGIQWWKVTGETGTFAPSGGRAYAVTADSQTAAGYMGTPSGWHAFHWTSSGGIQDLGVTTGTESLGYGVSANGALVFGEARDAQGFWRAFRWTASLGMRDMGTMGGPMSTAHGASADGSIIVGKSLIDSQSSSLRAFRWTAATGMRDLRQELLNAGVASVQNWTLAVAAGCSDDGSIIVGWGYPASLTPAQPFIAFLPVAGGGDGGITLSSLSLNPSTVTGGNSTTGTVTLSAGAPSGGAVVALSSANTSVATVPASVTVPAGSTSASFSITTVTVAANTSVVISGAYNASSRNATLTVNRPPTPVAPTLVSPANNATPAQPVNFDWNNVANAVSYTIQIDESTSFTAPLVASQSVSVSQATIGGLPNQVLRWRVRGVNSAGVAGAWSSTRSFTPQAAPAAPTLSAVALNPPSVVGGNTSQGTVTLTSAAPSGGAVVSLTSANTAVATVPASVTVAAGATTANFTVATVSVGANTSVSISGVYSGVTRSATLTVTPVPPPASLSSVSLNPTSVVGGNSSQGTVTLSSAAPSGGAVVSLSSANTGVATVPASVTVAAGATTASFTVTTVSVAATNSVTISAVYSGVTRTATLTVTPPAPAASLSSLALNPSTVDAGDDSTGTVTLTGPAPSGGAVVNLSSSNTSRATVPSSVTVAAGATSRTFTVSTDRDAGDSTVTITATRNGVTKTAVLTTRR